MMQRTGSCYTCRLRVQYRLRLILTRDTRTPRVCGHRLSGGRWRSVVGGGRVRPGGHTRRRHRLSRGRAVAGLVAADGGRWRSASAVAVAAAVAVAVRAGVPRRRSHPHAPAPPFEPRAGGGGGAWRWRRCGTHQIGPGASTFAT